ncbi:MAG: SPOR domain-containing protein [Vicinamibacterales bacterium]
MAELRDETTDDGFHEIQLSGKQLVFLFMVTTVTLIFVFLVGVLVGRGVDGRPGDEPIDSAEVATPATARGVGETGPVPAEPPSPPVEDELSYHKRLQSNAPADELKPEPQPEQPTPPAAQPPQQKPAPAGPDVPTTGRSGTWVLQITALKNRANAAELVQRLVGKGYPAFLQNPAPGEPVIYRVRVGRFGDRREAEQVRDRLQKEEDTSSVISR